MAKVTRITLDNSGGLDRRRLHLREISSDGDAPLENIGRDLRQARQKKGEDLAHISRIIKIGKNYLEAIEESNIEALPGRTYVIGFVRTYADYLGLDPDNAVERLKAEIAGRDGGKEAVVALSPPAERNLPKGGVIFAVLLFLVLIYSGYYLFVSAGRMTSQPVVPVPERLAQQAGISRPPGPEQSAVPAPPPPNVAPATAPIPPAPAAAAPPAPALAPPTTSAAPVAQTVVLPAGTKYGAQNSNSRVTLRAHRLLLVTVEGPGKLFLKRHLSPGDSYLVPNLAGLKLTVPNAGAVEVILDGGSVGFVGKDGASVEKVSLNPQDIVDRTRDNR
jgi:cytoskeleton protein RodZ